MSKSKTFAAQQVRRLRSKPFYPLAETDGEKLVNHGERELARTLFTYAESDLHMERVVDAAVIRRFGENGADRCPSPSDLWALCGSVSPTPPAVMESRINPDCPECSGIGYVFVRRIGGITGASSCPRGCLAPGYSGLPSVIAGKALGAHYRSELAGAEDRRAAFIASRGKPVLRITDADIETLRRQQDANRATARLEVAE